MNGGKKWVLVVTEEQYDWITDVAKKTSLKGSDVVREIIDNTMKGDDKKFINSLSQAQLRIKMQELNDKAAAIEDAKRQLRKEFAGEKVEA